MGYDSPHHPTRNKRDMKTFIKPIKAIITGSLCLVLAFGTSSFAGSPSRNRQQHYPAAGGIVRTLPHGHQILRSGRQEYVYHRGVFYHPDHEGFRVIRPPRGLAVHHLPPGFETLAIAGITYFLFADIYYRQANTGYIVVDAPVMQQPLTPIVVGGWIVIVDTPLLNVRSGPGMSNPVIFEVSQETRLTVESTSDGWYFVRLDDGRAGWVMSGYTRQMPPEPKG